MQSIGVSVCIAILTKSTSSIIESNKVSPQGAGKQLRKVPNGRTWWVSGGGGMQANTITDQA